MNKLTIAFCMTLLASIGLARAASHEPHEIPSHQPSQATTLHTGTGVLRGINAAAGKVQIAHEPIAALGWPAMTMWFMLKTPLPQDIQIGDNVHFEMMQGDKNQWQIVKISRK
jgi:Cu/Ag efflux protein CusF